VIYTRFDRAGQSLLAARLAHGRWRTARVSPPLPDVPEWKGSLVLRGGGRYTLWTTPGAGIHRFTSTDGVRWRHTVAYRGPAWSLTGAPGARPGEELLLWRGRQESGRSWVMLGAASTR
jgi:hypothetical protein